jgi:hypothetical protein
MISPKKPGPATSPVTPLSEAVITWRKKAVAKALGISERALDRERAAGRFPAPDAVVGKMPLWRPETVRRWAGGGGT